MSQFDLDDGNDEVFDCLAENPTSFWKKINKNKNKNNDKNNDKNIVEISDETFDETFDESSHEIVKIKKNRVKIETNILHKYFHDDPTLFEIGVDEAGRGPLFGRVYTGAVILPKDDSFDHSKMKDSKKFHSKKKIQEVAEYIKENAIAWTVTFEDESVIDDINILQATQSSMHKSILETMKKHYKSCNEKRNYQLLIDGNYFKKMPVEEPFKYCSKYNTLCVEGGDNTYTAIAAASILAKVERDNYIDELCGLNPELSERYGIDTNKGYGAKKHLEGIKQYGITIWHRRSFGICKEYS
jgi:ribonuclease HII